MASRNQLAGSCRNLHNLLWLAMVLPGVVSFMLVPAPVRLRGTAHFARLKQARERGVALFPRRRVSCAVRAGDAAGHAEVPTSLEQVLTQAEEDFAAAVAMADFAMAVGTSAENRDETPSPRLRLDISVPGLDEQIEHATPFDSALLADVTLRLASAISPLEVWRSPSCLSPRPYLPLLVTYPLLVRGVAEAWRPTAVATVERSLLSSVLYSTIFAKVFATPCQRGGRSWEALKHTHTHTHTHMHACMVADDTDYLTGARYVYI